MEHELLSKYIEEGLSSWQVAARENVGQTTVRYWAKKHGLKFKGRYRDPLQCSSCKLIKTATDFYYSNGKRTGYCRPCMNASVADRARRIKAQAVAYKGGCCQICGYDRYVGSLSFHHLDPAAKDFAISGTMMSFENVKPELDKCVLLCNNCHGEVHGGIENVVGFEPTSRFREVD